MVFSLDSWGIYWGRDNVVSFRKKNKLNFGVILGSLCCSWMKVFVVNLGGMDIFIYVIVIEGSIWEILINRWVLKVNGVREKSFVVVLYEYIKNVY